ncbi:MAG: hypothetical protein FJX40_15635 [Alphaproteobacteria bacterium]|nr:hypothetical protein [Alphaproteobacteria bacterium]MBM3641919.1 hypothetical protein [Alphaproteobacteria bacterium]
MKSNNAKLSTDNQTVALFEEAANRFRTYFEREVLAALPEFARRELESELNALSFLSGADPVPALAEASLVRAEQCAHDLLSMNYDGSASSFLRRSVQEAAVDIKATVIAASRRGGNVITFPRRVS